MSGTWDTLVHVPSPCIKRCALDADGVCTGCRRTSAEISAWSAMTAAEQQAVWQRLLALPPRPERKRCSRCSAEFDCGTGAADGRCWCTELPAALPLDSGADCLCPACLRQRLQESGRL
ncbi:cysteine-rich CWC family protein [Chitinilyticum piscinae]|uniref:Cysteine-rich CWC family protein n=1 Tax=Chitinilyticum piscinae TaxID=2866724 RepID=A0A8J7KAK7_9NEIS|nr:cysteine-rich CWC family protein [Chitinilyticum piscinae]MBE9609244.1 cysteine-rich CWC family protein [Chitinilyticum piscinae]